MQRVTNRRFAPWLAVACLSACSSANNHEPSTSGLQRAHAADASTQGGDAQATDAAAAESVDASARTQAPDASHADDGLVADAGGSPDPFQATTSLPSSMKGYELYVWESAGALRFMLIEGTNREKTLNELKVENQWLVDGWVAISSSGLDRLAALIPRVPSDTPILLMSRADLGPLSAAARAQVEALIAK